MNVTSDEQRSLLSRAVGGDRLAIQQLLLRYYPRIEASVRSQFNEKLMGFIEPEDLIQEALIKVHRNIGLYQERDHVGFEAWLRAIIGNCVIDAARRCSRLKRGGKARQVQHRPVSADQSLDTIWDWVCQDSRLPDRSVRRAEARQAIQVCLSQLPLAQRDAVVAHYFEHLDAKDIAVRMNRTPGAVRELLRRARESLRDLMGSASVWLSSR